MEIKNFLKIFSIRKLIIITITIANSINQIKTNNSTACYEMYLNKTIKENCFNSTACCYLDYSLEEKNFTKCIKKLNYDENICSDVSDIAGKESVNMKTCDCISSYIDYSGYLLFFILINLLY